MRRTYQEEARRNKRLNILLAMVLVGLLYCIFFLVKANIQEIQEKVVASVATPSPTPTLKPTPRPKPIVKVKVRYKKGKLLQDHTVYHDSSHNRDKNLDNAAKKINGTKIMPDEEFSFYGVIEEPTEESGFVYAGGLESGQSVTTIAGGICQNATGLNTVIVDAGIQTYGNFHHSADVGYLNETDHEVTVTYGQYDLTFINTLPYPLLVKQKAIKGNVRTKLYKMRTIYIVTLKDAVTGEETVKRYSKKNMPEEYKLFIPEY